MTRARHQHQLEGGAAFGRDAAWRSCATHLGWAGFGALKRIMMGCVCACVRAHVCAHACVCVHVHACCLSSLGTCVSRLTPARAFPMVVGA